MLEILVYIVSFVSLFLAIFWISVLFFEDKKIDKNPPESNYFPTITMLIPAYNEAETIGGTLKSLLAMDYPKDKLDIIVVANNCIDNTADEVRKVESDKIKLIEISFDKSKIINCKAHAQNLALPHAKGELVTVMDADAIVQENALKLIVPIFQDENIGLVASSVKIKDPKSILEKLQWFEFLSATFIRRLMASFSVLFMTSGAFNVYRKSALELVGGFDNTTLTEDLDIALHLLQNFKKVQSNLDAVIHVRGMKTLKSFHAQRVRWNRGFFAAMLKYRNMIFNKKYGFLGQFMIPIFFAVPIMLIGAVSSITYSLAISLYKGAAVLSEAGRYFMNIPTSLQQSVWTTNMQILVPTIFLILCGSFILFNAHKYLKETPKYPIAGLLFLTVYQFALSAYWLIALCYELFGAKKIWRYEQRW